MDKTVIFIVIVIICVLFTVWSACVMAARADEQLREITDDKKEPEEKEEDMTKQRIGKIMNESVIRTRPPVEKPPKKGK